MLYGLVSLKLPIGHPVILHIYYESAIHQTSATVVAHENKVFPHSTFPAIQANQAPNCACYTLMSETRKVLCKGLIRSWHSLYMLKYAYIRYHDSTSLHDARKCWANVYQRLANVGNALLNWAWLVRPPASTRIRPWFNLGNQCDPFGSTAAPECIPQAGTPWKLGFIDEWILGCKLRDLGC